MGVYFPKKSHHGYFDKALGRHFYTKNEKREFMNANKIAEDGSMESERSRINHLTEKINTERNKTGLKSLTKEQIIGNSRETREWKFR